MRSDIEALYVAYREGGPAALAAVDGMFAGVLYYAPEDRFLAFRDPQGVKPLFLWNVRGASIVASEIKGLVAVAGMIPPYESAYVMDCLVHGHSLNPTRAPYAGVSQLAPGEIREVGGNSIFLCGDEREARVADDAVGDAALIWEGVLEASIVSTCTADDRPSVLLSGGVDSSLIADIATRATPHRIHTGIVAGFSNALPHDVARDESAYARLVAAECGLPTLETDVSGPRGPAELERIFSALEQPMFNSSPIVTDALGRCAAENGVHCVLSGDGLDELRLSYGRLRALDPEANISGERGLELYADDLVPLPESFYRRMATPEIASAFERRTAAIADTLVGRSRPSLADTLRAMELNLRLPNYHLARVDRLFMAHGVEARVPFLRRDVVGAAMERTATSVLREPAKLAERLVLARRFGAEIAWRPKVRFSGPINTWVRGWFAAGSPEEYIRSSARVRELARDSEVASLFRLIRSNGLSTDDGLVVWALACIASWEQGERRWAVAPSSV